MIAQVVAVKPDTTVPEVDRGEERFRVAKGVSRDILELVQAIRLTNYFHKN